MPIHFTTEELADRRRRTAAEMARRGLDALLIFRQESMYWLTGYDTFGYVFFQCLVLGADGRMTLLTRAPDLRQARFTSVVEDVRVWVDEAGATPEAQLRDILAEQRLAGGRLGVEWHAYGLTAAGGFRLKDALDGFCRLDDASDLVSRLRLVKSPAELAHVRRAAELVDAAHDAAVAETRAGAFEGDILAALQGAVFRGGGDDPANEQIIGSGPGALMCRYFTGRRHLSADDQMTLEIAGVHRHYHACLMRTVRVGPPPAEQRGMHAAAVESFLAAEAAVRPGRPLGEVFDAHARVLDAAGHRANRMNGCGYSLGATFAPNWMDTADLSMLFHGNPTPAAPGMVLFIHIIVFDSVRNLAMTSGATVAVTASGCERLTRTPLDLVVR
ncbi:MAG: aminopeptidase P family protein [Alphaproteobacteria bacterium]|nr:aminopeptidase P family protein [Alphaproteobacteria bacterium]